MDANFAQMSSLVDQRPNTTKPVAITLNHNDVICGISHVSEHSKDIVIEESGVYILIAVPQIGRLTGTEDRYVDFWLRRNGKDTS